MIYLDNNATTPVDPVVLEAMLPFLQGQFANASSGSTFARPVRKAVENARGEVAALLECSPDEIVFTGGGTEADNAALFSATQLAPGRRHLVIGATEHDAVLHYAGWLEKTQGYSVTRVPVAADGRVDPAAVAAAMRPDETAAVAVMWANNETGVLAPVAECAALAAAHGAQFLTDAVQAAGKVPLRPRAAGVPFLALSGHKFHAPKGTGLLFIDRNAPFQPWMIGGGQENRRRAGTENVAGIVALGAAAAQARRHLEVHADPATDPVRVLRDRFEAGACARISGVTVNGHATLRTPNTSSLRIAGTEAQGIILLLDQKGICVSAGSACTTGSLHPSHVLSAMGLTPDEARSTLRVSFSRFNTAAEVDTTLDALEAAVARFRALRPGM